MTHVFVVPPLDGPTSGGTQYNRGLIAALRRRGQRVRVMSSCAELDGFGWVDSLFLPEASWGLHTGLLAHYLPSLVTHGERVKRDALADFEREAIDQAAAFVAPSPWMADTLIRLGADHERVHVVEPAVSSRARVVSGERAQTLRGVVVGAVTPGKGLLALLEALQGRDAGWELDVAGSLDVDPPYAARCIEAARGMKVRWLGPLEPDACIDAIAGADVLVSASTMESYGMAIAEAQACGVPVLARAGGNVRALVERVAGGEVHVDAKSLADALVDWAHDLDGHALRSERARAAARTRDWDQAAADFVAATSP